ncbi:lysis system i-spanin subunit Rz [Phytopseudomonas dryadis]|uniref:Lysis protein n=1 Tax=Phytopseudomonas dryadis TaxID=2487520 RepID=A0A4V2KBS7_9GAMM|nr:MULTISPECIES: lysis system i-spanin subunit Rz [Pseudomonas]TBU88641.1 lysis protein [Pseudomonas dryadis]TBV01659.1 lysis protein [Pseudomonas dryadis]TBV14180.1 lysis protein [Pseudomonas sp. FRB 230]
MNWLSNYRLLASVALLVLALAGGAGLGWVVQGWRLEQQIARRDELHAATLAEIQRAAAGQAQREQEKRLQLERQLQASSETEYRKRTDAQYTAARLRDRLATADLRLSVLLAAVPAAAGGDGAVPTATGAGRLVDGGVRGDLDPGAAQRIVGIAERGDQAIIALGACQAYVRQVSQGRD